MKKTIIILHLFSKPLLFTLSAAAAVPLRWTVETSAANPATFDQFAGATYDLEATLQSRGKPLAVSGDPQLFWQTNGMGSAWWSAPATASGNVLRATWTPACDVGAKVYNCFIGITCTVYNAAFQLRLRPSPGAVPNALPLPTPVIDFSKVTVLNPPWSGGTDTNDVKAIVNAAVGGTNAVKAAIVDVASIKTDYLTASATNALDEAKRDKTDNTCRKTEFGEWTFSGTDIKPGSVYTMKLEKNEDYGTWYLYEDGKELDLCDYELADVDNVARIIPAEWTFDYRDITATRAVICTSNELYTTQSFVESQVDEAKAAANDANAWSAATYNFMTGGRTNCWFSGTNYVFGADAASRTRFAWEQGMDAATVPCSMALWEIRDGARQLVWDQRDWTAWYWSFKSAQMTADIQGRIDALGNAVTNVANYAWAKRYASDGTPNPDASTTFIDTAAVTLSPGMKWETVATVSGAAYWTIVGNGAVIGGSGTNAVLRIQDFEGNDIMTVSKGEHRLAWIERGDITGQMSDEDGWVCFDMLADTEPTGYFSTTLDSSDFLPQTDPDCPAQYRWEIIGGGKYRVHFLLKPGVQANACFAKFNVEVEGQTVIRYNAGQDIQGGLIYNGVKIAPDISGSPAVGNVIQWKVVR